MRFVTARLLFCTAVAVISVACSKQPLPDDGFVDVPGGRIAFRVIGSGDATPVLWIHGGPGGSSCGAVANVGGIARERPVILYDQLGSGYSDRIQDLEQLGRLPRFVEEVKALRAELGLDELHIVGHSWGNAVALEYLLTAEPKGVKSVVFASPYFGTKRWIADTDQLLKELPAETQQAVAAAVQSGNFDSEEFKAANRLFMSRYGRRTPAEQTNREPCERKPGGDSGLYRYMWGPSEFVSTGTLRDYDRTGRLAEIKLPVLFVTGQYDEARPETVEFFHEQVAGSRFEVLPDAAHSVYVDQTERFNELLAEFFAATDTNR
ncbi:MAG: proline iminopeptidase-family hydrolase [Woeseia sp.]